MGDHTETVQIDFDPNIISYSELLNIFFSSHNPAKKSWSRQYMNAVFYHNEQQRTQAMAAKAAIEKKTKRDVETQIVPIHSFTLAEDYHQKFTLKRHSHLVDEMTRYYPDHLDFVNSTAVARLNGYTGRNGTKEQLRKEIDRLGLSDKGKRVLTNMVRK